MTGAIPRRRPVLCERVGEVPAVSGSVYERRRLGWRDRLRSLVGREEPPAALIHPPQLVVAGGRAIGYRCQDGSVLRFPEPPSDPRLWPEGAWGEDEEGAWVRLRRR